MAAINFLYRSVKPESHLQLRLLFRFNDNDYVFGAKTKIVISKSNWTDIKSGKKITDANLKNKKLEKLPHDNSYKLYISSLLKNCGYKNINSTYKCSFYKPLISENLIN